MPFKAWCQRGHDQQSLPCKTVRKGEGAVEQRDAADEGRLEASGNAMVGRVIVNQGGVVRPSQLIASVGRAVECVVRVRNSSAGIAWPFGSASAAE